MAEAQDVETLKRRGRRRLVGAVALVLAAVIVLPMVFDPEPRRADVAVNVRIPGENDSKFAPKVEPKAPEQKIEEKKPEPKAEEKAPEPAKVAEAPKAEPRKAEPKKSEPKKAEPKPVAGGGFVVQAGSFGNPKDAIAKLKAANVPHYTEAAPNNLTRVVAGPFRSKAEAEKALQALKAMGFRPGNVKSG